ERLRRCVRPTAVVALGAGALVAAGCLSASPSGGQPVATVRPGAPLPNTTAVVPFAIQTAVAQQASTVAAAAPGPTWTPPPASTNPPMTPVAFVTPILVYSEPPTPVGGGGVSAAPSPFEDVPRIGLEEARTLIETQRAVVGDVRGPGEFSQGHIPGAIL